MFSSQQSQHQTNTPKESIQINEKEKAYFLKLLNELKQKDQQKQSNQNDTIQTKRNNINNNNNNIDYNKMIIESITNINTNTNNKSNTIHNQRSNLQSLNVSQFSTNSEKQKQKEIEKEKEKEIKENKENKETKPYKWKFQNENEINQILLDEHAEFKSNENQKFLLNVKLNRSFLFYLLTEFKKYSISMRHIIIDNFIYITKITKRKQIIFDISEMYYLSNAISYHQFESFWRKIQILKLAEIIEKEKQFEIQFDGTFFEIELKRFVDHEKHEINLFDFFKKYDKQQQLMKLINTQNKQNDSINLIEMNETPKKKQTKKKWIYHDTQAIEYILSKEKEKQKRGQLSAILRKLNFCMIYLIMKECKGYYFDVENSIHSKRKFLYVEQIQKRNKILFDGDKLAYSLQRETDQKRDLLRRKEQIVQLAEIVENEIGIVFIFEMTSSDIELQNVIDNEGKEINLIEFIDKYDDFDDVCKMLKNQNKYDIMNDHEEQMECDTNSNQQKDDDSETSDSTLSIEEENKIEEEQNEKDEEEELKRKTKKTIKIENDEYISILLSSFNTSLISILYSFDYNFNFINPRRFNDYRFLYINSIRKEKENCCVYDFELKENERNMSIKRTRSKKDMTFMNFVQIDSLMKLIEKETSIVFLFDGFDIQKHQFIPTLENPQIDQLMIKVKDTQLSIQMFIEVFNQPIIHQSVLNHFRNFNTSEFYQMIQIGEKVNFEIEQNNWKLFNSNENELIDEWNRIFIYLLIENGYSITFTEESIHYLNVFKYLRMKEYLLEEEKKTWENHHEIIPSHTIDLTIKEYMNNWTTMKFPIEDFLMIESIEKDDKQIIFAQTKESQMKRLIWMINNETEWMIIFSNNYHKSENKNEIQIPWYLIPKSIYETSLDFNPKQTYYSKQFIQKFHVNEIIEKTVQNSLEENKHQTLKNEKEEIERILFKFYIEKKNDDIEENNSENEKETIEFPKNYLRKRMDEENDVNDVEKENNNDVN